MSEKPHPSPASSHTPEAKLRVLYIRHNLKLEISESFRMNQDEWVEAMSELSEVFIMRESFDMKEACDRLKPDFIIYESPALYPQPLIIKNATAHPDIPRIAFQMQDPYCSTRVNFLRTIEDMNIKWMFTHMPEIALRQSPELKTRTFSVSHMFDERIFYDYKSKKDIPVSVFGGFLAPEIYNWRAETLLALPHRFPTLIYTHPGYRAPVPKHKFPVQGETYAKLLNRSYFSLADTTRFDCFLRKHLEIPASGAILVAPDTPALKPYGFKDMENCILGSGSALFDKIEKVAEDPELYEKICRNGYDLAHGKYERKDWRGFLDFYECLKKLQPGQTIKQRGLFGIFELVNEDDSFSPAIIDDYPDGEASTLSQMWIKTLLTGSLTKDLEEKMAHLQDWLSRITEHWIPMGIFALTKGDMENARKFFLKPQEIRKAESGFTEYDPEEIAWLSLTAALSGDVQLINMTRKESASLRHLSIRRMMWLGNVLSNETTDDLIPNSVNLRSHNDHLSIHWTGQLEIRDWLNIIRRILDANGHQSLLLPLAQ